MNKTKIEWTDWSLNPIVGCLHRCPYCYARKQAVRQKQRCSACYDFIPHPHLERLDQLSDRQKPSRIFIDSMWDWNSEGVQAEWLAEILKKMRECPQHDFQILTKRPLGYGRFLFPPNAWLGTSIAKTADCHRITELASLANRNLKFVSVEPIHERIDFQFKNGVVDWIIIGAETGNRIGKIIAKKEWVEAILKNAREEEIPVFIKNNLCWPIEIKEFPEERR